MAASAAVLILTAWAPARAHATWLSPIDLSAAGEDASPPQVELARRGRGSDPLQRHQHDRTGHDAPGRRVVRRPRRPVRRRRRSGHGGGRSRRGRSGGLAPLEQRPQLHRAGRELSGWLPSPKGSNPHAGGARARLPALRLAERNARRAAQPRLVRPAGSSLELPNVGTPDANGAGAIGSVVYTTLVNTAPTPNDPGSVTTGARAIWELVQVQVFDGVRPGTAGAADATLFKDEGVFVP